MTQPKLETLEEDIRNLIEDGFTPSSENMKIFLTDIRDAMRSSFRGSEKPRLRISNIGLPNRKLYYSLTEGEKFDPSPSDKVKFFVGHFLEALFLLFAREAGHNVEEQQKEINIDGVLGHQDARIDEATVDVKSASNYAFWNKFKKKLVLDEDDPFGYIAQLSGYYHEDDKTTKAAFLAIDRHNGDFTVMEVPTEHLIDPVERIKDIKAMLEKGAVPEEKCYEPVPHGKAGNMKLPTNCHFCDFKFKCYKDANEGRGVRSFRYSNQTVDLVHVEKEPKVDEVF